MKQRLGEKKRKRVEQALNKPVAHAIVRGGWPVNWCQAWTDQHDAWWVNFKTGEVGHKCYSNGERVSDFLNDAEEHEHAQRKAVYEARVSRILAIVNN